MTKLSANIKLRPTRIGFLVKPNDTKSVKRIMTLNTCLWGGRLNPIIPVYQRAPKEWSTSGVERVKGYNVGKGYIEFFEPDVFVESEPGLHKKLDLIQSPEVSFSPSIISLDNYFQETRGQKEIYYGLGIFDVLKRKYDSERKFELRHKAKAVMPKPVKGSGVMEAVYGCYPNDEELGFNGKAYEDVFQPHEELNDLKLWRETFIEGVTTPLRTTLEHLDVLQAWHDDLTIYVFDPKKTVDLIDLWNMRIEPRPILPVPINLLSSLTNDIQEILNSEFRPIKGNSNGVMHRPTIEFSRSLTRNKTPENIRADYKLDAMEYHTLKLWRNDIWTSKKPNHGPRYSRIEYECSSKATTISVDTDGYTEFETLSPSFAKKYNRQKARWANVLTFNSLPQSEWATLLPLNSFDKKWPRISIGSDITTISSEGWVFSQKNKRETQFVTMLSLEQAVIEWLSENGIQAKVSDPGQNAKQIIEATNGLRGLSILKDPITLKLLNKLAGGQRIRSNEDETIVENFQDRTISIKDFESHISKIKNQGFHRPSSKNFIEYGILKIGLKTQCTYCKATNWRGLDNINYEIICDRCLENYQFPQSNLQRDNGNWHYRILGPFSIPDYAQGAYSSVLTISALSSLIDFHGGATYAPSLDLEIEGKCFEVDFAMWVPPSPAYQSNKNPILAIGEAKSFALEAIKKKDITQLKELAKKLPMAAIVISVLKDSFSELEKELISKFILWDRKTGSSKRERRTIVLMTGTELFADFSIQNTWKDLGGAYEKHSNYHSTNCLENFANATQEIYLGIEPYYDWLAKHMRQSV